MGDVSEEHCSPHELEAMDVFQGDEYGLRDHQIKYPESLDSVNIYLTHIERPLEDLIYQRGVVPCLIFLKLS
uniref:Uncharacterized protein n=1 Tax=Lepeophtheirus salmonis TaxID=72036 RepID=A0A0K2UR91_LEPSM